MNCICLKNQGSDIVKICVICNKNVTMTATDYDIKKQCPVHKYKCISFCGECEFVCDICTMEGWYSTAGCGGGTYHLNSITNQEKLKDGTIITNQ